MQPQTNKFTYAINLAGINLKADFGATGFNLFLAPGKVSTIIDALNWASRILVSDVIPSHFFYENFKISFSEDESVLVTIADENQTIALDSNEINDFILTLKNALDQHQNDLKYNKITNAKHFDSTISGPGDTFV